MDLPLHCMGYFLRQCTVASFYVGPFHCSDINVQSDTNDTCNSEQSIPEDALM